jgi:hypothetical protein
MALSATVSFFADGTPSGDGGLERRVRRRDLHDEAIGPRHRAIAAS